mmetsp:Transcript_23036/g.42438  ORF Transcript_23036/g.42438 Transcript_23036/m.42438 type:complete len:298 (-) Transcript_23036:69-962(-)
MSERWPRSNKLPIGKWGGAQRPEPATGLQPGDVGHVSKSSPEPQKPHNGGDVDKLFWAFREHTVEPATSSSKSAKGATAAEASEIPATTIFDLAVCGCDGTHREPTEVDVRMPPIQLPVMPMATAEQRWVWREFLQETISRTQVTDMYAHFDVDADPPSYKRPPPSRNPVSRLYSRSQSMPLEENQGDGYITEASSSEKQDKTGDYSVLAQDTECGSAADSHGMQRCSGDEVGIWEDDEVSASSGGAPCVNPGSSRQLEDAAEVSDRPGVKQADLSTDLLEQHLISALDQKCLRLKI